MRTVLEQLFRVLCSVPNAARKVRFLFPSPLLTMQSAYEAFLPKNFVRPEPISFEARDSFVVVHSRNEVETTQSTQERKEEPVEEGE